MIAHRLVFSLALIPLGIFSVSAQDAGAAFNRAPAGVEEVLRDRVKQFYALHMEGKFRQAEAFVCADSKDTFYDSDKRRWQSADILKINFDKDFKSATVVVTLGSEMRTRVGTIPAAFPLATSWKQEGESWCYHVLPPNKAVVASPWGSMQQKGDEKGVSAAEAPVRPDPSNLINAFKLSKREFLLKGYENSTDSIDIYNGMPGQVRLDVQAAQMGGLKWELSKKVLESGEHGALKLTYVPPDKSPKSFYNINLLVEPLGAVIALRVVFDIPEDVKKQLPFVQK
ncbi:MAG: hypothetical protein QM757_40570 [Paludibaculum sp.]